LWQRCVFTIQNRAPEPSPNFLCLTLVHPAVYILWVGLKEVAAFAKRAEKIENEFKRFLCGHCFALHLLMRSQSFDCMLAASGADPRGRGRLGRSPP